jgi:hypothetical protein
MSYFIFLCIFVPTFNLLFMKKMILLFSVGMLFTALSSCKKAGCTDLKADNYSSKAKTNDGSCTYSEKLIFWQNYASTQTWGGSAVLKIYVDGAYLGSFATSEYIATAPDCASNGQLNKTIDFGNSTTKTVNVKVVDEDDYEWYNQNITMSAGSCTTYQIL